MKLLVTGASGFVGAKVVELALAAGHEVAATTRPGNPSRRLAPLAGRYLPLAVDLRERRALFAAVASFRPDAIIHLAWAGVANSARFEKSQFSDNIDAACALVDAGAAAGCKAFIGTGSQGEYGAGSSMREDCSAPADYALWRGESRGAVSHPPARRSRPACATPGCGCFPLTARMTTPAG